ncbi:MAG: hypothetical protein WDZ49_02360 [Litorilinea sp.]
MAPGIPAEVRELKALAGDGEAQAALAARLLNPRKGLAVVQAALGVAIRYPQPANRSALFDLYHYYAEHATRDPACYVRSQILQALRPVAEMTDLPFFWAAAETYVFPPPEFTEEGGLLRANALLVINDLDDGPARYAATRLLVDEHTAPMSGEPAVTAAQVLAGLGEQLPLYLYAMQPGDRILPEVGAQVLRGLANLPQPMLGQVIARFVHADPPPAGPVIAGLFDMLLACETMPEAGHVYLVEFLGGHSQLDLYRYLATLLVTTPGEAGWAVFEEAAPREDVPARLRILCEALDVALDQRRAAALATKLRARL